MATVEDYKVAMNELAAATEAYKPIDKYLTQIREAVGYGNGSLQFLNATFGLKYERNQRGYTDTSKYRLDLTKWPSAETVTGAGNRLAAAYNEAHRIYAALAQEDREYIKSPPYHVELGK